MKSKLAAIAVAILGVTATSTAHAEPRNVDWLKVIYDLDGLVRGFGPPAPGVPVPGGGTAAIAPRSTEGARPPSDDPAPQNAGNALFGVAPRVTLVARDWASSMRIAGEQLSLVDAMRLSASTRMVVGRARWSGARLTPFVQVGLGQWRVDRNYLPLTPNSEDVAGQFGGGFELRVSRRCQLAAEASTTTLLREGQNKDVPQTMLWSTFIASRIEF